MENQKGKGDKMNVLSLFDGMSCGQIALERAGIKVDKYYASEIKEHAIKVTKYNYPDTIHVGNVQSLITLPDIDLLIGGSPCQDFTRLKTNLDRKGLEGDKSKLFYEYLRLLKTIKPKYFLLENVRMKPKQKQELDEYLGVEGININSNLLTFQNRDRFYWTNIPGVTIPKDKKVDFQDFKETDKVIESEYKVNKTPSRIKMWQENCPDVTNREKINCITCKQDRRNNAGLVKLDDFCRYLTVRELEDAQTVPIGYTDVLSRAKAYDVLGDGWTVDVIAHIFQGIKNN